MSRTLLEIVLLAAMWVALWGDLSAGTVVAGLAAGTAVAVLVPTPEVDRRLTVRPLPAIRFLMTFALMLAVSTWAVVRLVLSDRAASASGVLIGYELAPSSYPVRTLIAHSISLTPGTLTVDVAADGRTLTVHVLDEDTVVAARRAIAALEMRAVRAFAPEPSPAVQERP